MLPEQWLKESLRNMRLAFILFLGGQLFAQSGDPEASLHLVPRRSIIRTIRRSIGILRKEDSPDSRNQLLCLPRAGDAEVRVELLLPGRTRESCVAWRPRAKQAIQGRQLCGK